MVVAVKLVPPYCHVKVEATDESPDFLQAVKRALAPANRTAKKRKFLFIILREGLRLSLRALSCLLKDNYQLRYKTPANSNAEKTFIKEF